MNFPNASDTIIGRNTVDTVANKTMASSNGYDGLSVNARTGFSVSGRRIAINVLNTDGSVCIDHGESGRTWLIRNNNGATTLMSLTESITTVPALTLTSSTASTSTSTGALICPGGVGVSGRITTGGGVSFLTSGGTAGVLNHYESTSHNTTFTGPYTTSTLTLNLERIGNEVSCRIPNITASSGLTTALTASVAIPSSYRPSLNMSQLVFGASGGSDVTVRAQILTSGVISFAPFTGGFAIGSTGSVSPTTLTWLV